MICLCSSWKYGRVLSVRTTVEMIMQRSEISPTTLAPTEVCGFSNRSQRVFCSLPQLPSGNTSFSVSATPTTWDKIHKKSFCFTIFFVFDETKVLKYTYYVYICFTQNCYNKSFWKRRYFFLNCQILIFVRLFYKWCPWSQSSWSLCSVNRLRQQVWRAVWGMPQYSRSSTKEKTQQSSLRDGVKGYFDFKFFAVCVNPHPPPSP